jgi:TPR repeat protein
MASAGSRLGETMRRFVFSLTLVAGCLVFGFQAGADPFQEAETALEAHKPAAVLPLMQRRADQGDARAEFLVAQAHWQQFVDGQSDALAPALAWQAKAAEQGFVPAQRSLARWLESGFNGSKADPVASAKWFKAAAEQGDAESQYSFGLCLLYGRGVPSDPVEAARWLKKALAQGQAGGARFLAELYEKGSGVPQDDTAAFQLYQVAAQGGFGDAALGLGRFYEAGRGVARDKLQAYAWYVVAVPLQGDPFDRNRLAAELTLSELAQGQAMARDLFAAMRGSMLSYMDEKAVSADVYVQLRAGYAYADGSDVPQDFKRGIQILRKLADGGLPAAQFQLALIYEEGRGLQSDPVEAYVLYTLAVHGGVPNAEEAKAKAEAIAAGLDADTLSYAKQRAAAWKPKAAP